MDKCPTCGEEMQSFMTHICNPMIKELYRKPKPFDNCSGYTGDRK